MKEEGNRSKGIRVWLTALFLLLGLSATATAQQATKLSHEQVENLVRRSYQYVAMYNINNKFALKQGGWNTVAVRTEIKDQTERAIARPNNDTLYVRVLWDLRKEPLILDMPAIDSKYVSLMITGYDHYVNVPMSTRLGDFKKPEKMLIYSARTQGYTGETIKGVDRKFEVTGDFVSAILRVMPHAKEKERFDRIVKQMQSVKAVTRSEYQGGQTKPINDIEFPAVGMTDADVFENNLLEVMQFVFNHTTFDAKDEIDRGLLAAYKPLGIEPGKSYDASRVKKIAGEQFRRIAQQVQQSEFARARDSAFIKANVMNAFQPKGKMALDLMVFQSVIGPIGQPATEAMYPPVISNDGQPMNAQHDYVVRMTKDELPPARAFWSLTLYDLQNGFFVPNDRKKYSVGENAGMKINKDGGIEIYIAAEQPKGVPAENWLPINRKDENIDLVLRLYVPNLEKMKTWKTPKAEKLGDN